jgi:ferric-dicitrate binding protein FerR (iron transport regulator)
LSARDVAYAHDGHVTLARGQNIDALLGFVAGRLVLTDVRLRDAIVELDRWYDVDIRLDDDALGDRRINTTLTGTSVEELVYVLGLTFNARVVRHGRHITLYSQG